MLRGQKRFTMLETRNDGVRFTHSKLRSESEQYKCLRERYNTVQAAIAEEVLAIAGGYAEPLASLSSLLAKMDVLIRSVSSRCCSMFYCLVLCSFADVSANAPTPYVRPILSGLGKVAPHLSPE